MKLQTLIDELQQIAHMGHAQDEVLLTDLTNARGAKMLEALRPRLIGYTACDGNVALRIQDEQAPDSSYPNPRITCEFCNTDVNVQPLYKFTDDIRVWNYVRKYNVKKMTENSWVCANCAFQLKEQARD